MFKANRIYLRPRKSNMFTINTTNMYMCGVYEKRPQIYHQVKWDMFTVKAIDILRVNMFTVNTNIPTTMYI